MSTVGQYTSTNTGGPAYAATHSDEEEEDVVIDIVSDDDGVAPLAAIGDMDTDFQPQSVRRSKANTPRPGPLRPGSRILEGNTSGVLNAIDEENEVEIIAAKYAVPISPKTSQGSTPKRKPVLKKASASMYDVDEYYDGESPHLALSNDSDSEPHTHKRRKITDDDAMDFLGGASSLRDGYFSGDDDDEYDDEAPKSSKRKVSKRARKAMAEYQDDDEEFDEYDEYDGRKPAKKAKKVAKKAPKRKPKNVPVDDCAHSESAALVMSPIPTDYEGEALPPRRNPAPPADPIPQTAPADPVPQTTKLKTARHTKPVPEKEAHTAKSPQTEKVSSVKQPRASEPVMPPNKVLPKLVSSPVLAPPGSSGYAANAAATEADRTPSLVKAPAEPPILKKTPTYPSATASPAPVASPKLNKCTTALPSPVSSTINSAPASAPISTSAPPVVYAVRRIGLSKSARVRSLHPSSGSK